MTTSEWLVCTTPEHVALMGSVVRELDPGARMRLVADARALRNQLLSAPGVAGAAVGFVGGAVSDVNLAAAVAADGCARRVVLVRSEVSGSLKSRSRQAGIDMVVQAGDGGTLFFSLGEEGSATDGDSNVPQERRKLPSPSPSAAMSSLAMEPLDEPDASTVRHLTHGSAPIVTFCSGRGGVGVSTLVGLSALTAASWGMRVVVLDLDLTSGNLRAMLGNDANAHALGSRGGEVVLPLDDVFGVSDAFAAGPVVLGPCERPEMAEEVIPHAQTLLTRVAERCDLVLVDTPTTVTDAMAAAMQASERVLLVSDDQPGGLASLARVSGLAVRLGVARTRIMRVENRGDPRDEVNLSIGRAEVGLEVARVLRAYEGGLDVAELAAEGRLSSVREECKELSSSVATLLAQVLSEIGCLPDSPAAKEALQGMAPKKRRLFAIRREAS